MKKIKIKRAKDILERKFGNEGTRSRETFKATAFSNYFGEIIRNRRKKLKLSQEELARLVGKKRPYISRVENGEDLRISNLLILSNALNLKLELIELENEG